ncbi:MAG: lysophospholipid acyltransferase family protein [Cellvibrionales bacterium]|nr:lysophospholipid acyltransferase family protein [Cellvibrionales bacterium]
MASSLPILFIRSLLFYILYALFTFTFGFILLLIKPFLSQVRKIHFLNYWGILVLYSLRITCGIRFTLSGLNNLPSDHRFVMLANHQSEWETYYFGYLFQPIAIVLKQELLKIPVFGWCISQMNHIAIDRSNPRHALKSIQTQGLSRLTQDNMPVLIFPEGTRRKPGDLGKFSRGGAQLAINAKVPVLFVSHNSGECWIPGKFLKSPGTISVSISPCHSTEHTTASELTDKARHWIANQLSN